MNKILIYLFTPPFFPQQLALKEFNLNLHLLSPCPNKYNVAARNTILILFLAAEDDKNVTCSGHDIPVAEKWLT
jgi:hypothetical protein